MIFGLTITLLNQNVIYAMLMLVTTWIQLCVIHVMRTVEHVQALLIQIVIHVMDSIDI